LELNHSVAILGWGKDPASGHKVWIIRNSFGPNWGERGDLYIRRGYDDFGIESEVSGYNVTAL
jgi:C1A family cysteine protease